MAVVVYSTEGDRYIEALIPPGTTTRAADGQRADGATHEIVADEQGNLTVVRRSFSIG